jgi:hypothetical protein
MRIKNHQILENAQRPKSAKWNTLISSRNNYKATEINSRSGLY